MSFLYQSLSFVLCCLLNLLYLNKFRGIEEVTSLLKLSQNQPEILK